MLSISIKKLYLHSLAKNGISQNAFSSINPQMQTYLQKISEKYFLKPEFRKNLTVVMAGGVFDIIHPGHVMTLREAKKYGDVLVVAVATDETVKKTKNREPMHSQQERIMMVNMLKPVDLAIAGGQDWQDTLKRVSPDIVVFGYDQTLKEIPGIKVIKLEVVHSHPNSKTGAVREKLGI